MTRTSRMLHTNNITSSRCKAMLRRQVFPARSSAFSTRAIGEAIIWKTTSLLASSPKAERIIEALTHSHGTTLERNFNFDIDLACRIMFVRRARETEALLFTTNYISLSWRATRYLMLTSVSHNQITNKTVFLFFLVNPGCPWPVGLEC